MNSVGFERRPSWRAARLDPDRSLGLRLTLAAVAAFLVLVPFALLALLVLGAWPPLFRLDAAITDALHGYALDHPAWVRVMSLWTDVFAPGPLRVAAAVVVGWLFLRRAPRVALWVATTMTVGGLLGGLLKLLVGRHRPDLLDPVAQAAGYSFPSGHALNAALAAGVLLLVFLPYARDRRGLRWGLWTAAVLLAVVTGLSRIALGVHWTSDVVGGWLLGAAVVAATAAAFTTWRTRIGRPVRTTREGVEPELAEPGPNGPHA
ncbi:MULTISPECIES: phosphatase PAP2 family protein [Micromonospora]|uniref:Phosphatase PAP2 family protein n=1 Tax=Micromonospora solifontis TaxID=2487138 RepID=A0ABX9WGS2_9ACTN|nr:MULTISPECIES: phosphatase PAP2 family protein [Micromonospora]NES14730.1 phosphatase PAP2 family protein [Micromonospora sp. PPF5-17B]NES36711.1 phosphatase PAP2 family protein [Micromonospora solifontis]NES55738.1 phosphatase PAP2 family protein [Micromonospora sp. PPF5-6]RNL99172.1 phosphatase PAP2 family protein [Micromonospora solifontis]